MDLQVGGSSLFAVRKDNSILFSGGGNNGRLFTTGGILSYSAAAADFAVNGADNVRRASIGANGVRLISGAVVDWSSNANGPATANVDLILRRRGAANLQLGAADAAAPVAQTLSVQSVVGGTSNTAGANLTITGSQGTGTGAGGSIIFQVAPAGSAGTAQNALVNVLTIAPTGVVTIDNASLSLGANRQIRFATTPITYIAPRSSTANDINFGLDAASPLAVTIGAPGGRTGTDTNTAGANFILRGGLGTGSANGGNLQFAVSLPGGSGSTSNAATNIAYFAGASGHMLWNTDNTYDIGASGATRPRDLYLGGRVYTTSVQASTATGITLRGNTGTGVGLIDVNGSFYAAYATPLPAGGTTGRGLHFSSNTTNFGVFFGSGAPTLSAAKGSLYLRSDGSTTNDRMYVNTDGSTTWTAVTTAA